MKAILQNKYGAPLEVLTLGDADRPAAADGQVVVRVHAVSLHIGDYLIMTGSPFVLRLAMGLMKPRQPIPGMDVAGTVESVGGGVTGLKPGDEVFGWCGGALAEYACAPAEQFVAKPATLSFEEASAVGVSAFAALHAVRDQAGVQPGHKVLINGASGGVGTFAVQIARAYGADVTGVCSTRNVEMVRELGAEHVIDYTQEDFTAGEDKYDFILDVAGSRSLAEYRRVLTPKGVVVPVGGPPSLSRPLKMLMVSMFVSQQGRPFVSASSGADLIVLKDLVEAGKVKPVIDKTYPLAEAAQAAAYLGAGHASAKVVVRVFPGAVT
jgi:NADPH:quinone reductase-like Zn-dependent oxidoreductase